MGSFAEIITTLMQQRKPACAICDSPERDEIEAAHRQGAPISMIAQALQTIGAIDPAISSETAARRVRAHFDGVRKGTH